MHPNAERVREALTAAGIQTEVVEVSESTRSAAEAAETLGVEVEQIAKSLIFRVADEAVLVIASGGNRVSTKKLKALLGGKIRRADAEFVKAKTGFPIGGVSPVGHSTNLRTLIDEDLRSYDTIWAAAGTPFAVFSTCLADLERMTGGQVADVKEEV